MRAVVVDCNVADHGWISGIPHLDACSAATILIWLIVKVRVVMRDAVPRANVHIDAMVAVGVGRVMVDAALGAILYMNAPVPVVSGSAVAYYHSAHIRVGGGGRGGRWPLEEDALLCAALHCEAGGRYVV